MMLEAMNECTGVFCNKGELLLSTVSPKTEMDRVPESATTIQVIGTQEQQHLQECMVSEELDTMGSSHTLLGLPRYRKN